MTDRIDKTSPVPLYAQLERVLTRRIAASLDPGEPLGTIDEIARSHDVSSITVKHALYRMAEAGLVKSIKSKGYFVLKTPPKSAEGARLVAFLAFIGERFILNPMYVRLFEGALSVLSQNDLTLNLYSAEEIMSGGVLRNPDFFGFIIVGLRNPGLLDALFSSNARFVLADVPSKVHPSVLTDNNLGSRMAVGHLLGLGHRRIAIVNGNLEDQTFAARFEGYRETLRENNISFRKEFVLDDFKTPPSRRMEHMRRMLALPNPPTAVFFSSDPHAAFYVPLLQAAGVGIPRDLSVVGYDDKEESFHMNPQLTTVRQPMFEVGAAAARMLLEMEGSGGGEGEEPVLIKPALMVRGSTKRIA